MRNEIKTDKFLDGIQIRHKMIKEATGVAFITMINGSISTSTAKKAEESAARTVPRIKARENPSIILTKLNTRVAQMQDELLYDSAFVEWAGQTTPEQWAEIDNLFTEGTDNFAENANFEALAAKPAPTTEQTPKTTSNDNNSQRTEQPAPAADGESSSDVGRGERSDPRTGDDADFGQPESEPRAVRHGRGLDAISGDLTDEERKTSSPPRTSRSAPCC